MVRSLFACCFDQLCMRTLNCAFADCCRPIGLELWSVVNARLSFISSTVHQMESNHPQAVLEIVAHSAAMFPIGPDGSVRSINSGKIQWQPRLPTVQELTGAFAHFGYGWPSAASVAVGFTDLAMSLGEPFSAEVSDATSLDSSSLDITALAKSASCCCGHVQLPAAILEIALDTPSSVLGLTYRRYIKTAFLPGIGRVAELLRAHSATIEVGDATNGRAPRTSGSSSDFCTAPSCAQFAGCGMVQWPSLAWLKKKYPKRSGTESADWHAQQWLAYIRSWDTLLAAWAEDDFTTMWF